MRGTGILLIGLLVWGVNVMGQQKTSFELMMHRIFADQQAEMTEATLTKAKEYASTLRADGGWEDIAYERRDISNWPAGAHFERLQPMIMAYTGDGNLLYGDSGLKSSIDKALSFWAQHDFRSDNWWHNEIATPKAIGTALIMLHFGKELIEEGLKDALVKKMERGDAFAKTGANKSDIAMHYFYRALLTNDEKLLVSSLEQLYYPVKLVDGEEGLQHDYSYLQHGPQLYIAGYGEEFLKGISKIMYYVRETDYRMPSDQLALFSTFLKDTYLPTVRYGYIDFNVHGRGVSRPGILQKNDMLEVVKRMVVLDTDNKSIWQEAIRELEGDTDYDQVFSPVHKHFWKGDYTIHLRENYHFNVRLASDRTYKSEAGNEENIYGKNMTDGVTNIQVFGDEYYDIMPLWEWDKIPGTTTRDYREDQLLVEQWGKPAKNQFAGGVSDGRYGASAMQVDYDSVSANKAWFFFDNQVVCLGSGITSQADEPIVTTLNQTWLKGNIVFNGRALSEKDRAALIVNAGDRLMHNRVIYFFPEDGDASLRAKQQQGTWSTINRSRSADTVSGEVFKLWLNHGIRPQNARYAYIVYPGTNRINQQELEAVRILQNTETVQAVSHATLGITQVVFYEAGVFVADDLHIAVDKPCFVQLIAGSEEVELAVADPLQTAEEVQVVLDVKSHGIAAKKTIPLPQGAERGKTITILCRQPGK